MDTAVRQSWTREDFFAWAEAQEERYEFDGTAPVAMTGGNLGHSRIMHNLFALLQEHLRGTSCTVLGPDAAVATRDGAIRYPDVLVTASPFHDDDRTAPNPLVLFEVVSPTSGHIDRIVKVREYKTVPSVLRYVLVETASPGLVVYSRTTSGQSWTATTLTPGDTLPLPELGITLPLNAIYDRPEPA